MFKGASRNPLSGRTGMVAGAALSALLLSLTAGGPAQASLDPVVAVTGGRVQGRLLPDAAGAVFKGIPFTAPPVGTLRWREPQPVKPWQGVRQAVDYAPACVQAGRGGVGVAAGSSEDCLYLNVWTRPWSAKAKAKAPVMVWLYGGANTGGTAVGSRGIEPPFDGASLAGRGVVVVTINYRLGLFGFVGHPELAAESPHHASGGYGLLDQVAALQWVHANIAKFGGDPGNVTLFGQSAGSQDTSILVASPLVKGLLHRAIAESGTPMLGNKRLQTPAQTAHLGEILGEVLKAPAEGTVAYLRGLSAEQVQAASADFRKAVSDQHLIFDVGMDGYVVPTFAPDDYRKGREAHVPMIIGSNGLDSPNFRPGGPTAPLELMQATVKARIAATYGKYPDLVARAEAAYGLSPGGTPPSTYPPYGPLELQYAVDQGFRCEGNTLADWHGAVAPTYRYEFTAGTPAHPPLHSGELDFVFGYLRDQASEPALSKLSDQMQQYWTNFARTGDPNGPGLPRWGRYDAKGRAYIELSNQGPLAKTNLRGAACDIFTEMLTRDLVANGR